MSQKSTKKLKELKEQLKRANEQSGDWMTKYYTRGTEIEKLEAVIKAMKQIEGREIDLRERLLNWQIDNLKEIIRWLIKPSTTQRKPDDSMGKAPRKRW